MMNQENRDSPMSTSRTIRTIPRDCTTCSNTLIPYCGSI